MQQSPIARLHKEAGTKLMEAHGWELPAVYSSIEAEYEAATRRVGLVDRSYVGRIRATGKDALDLLNRLSTNKLEGLSEGQGAGTVLTSNKGRIIDLLFVFNRGGHLLLVTSPETRQKVMEWVEFYTFSEDVSLQDVTEETVILSLMGPGASGLLDAMAPGAGLSRLARFGSVLASIGGVEVTALRTDFAGLPEYSIVAPSAKASDLWEALLELGRDAGIRPIGMQALEVIRIENGVPGYGAELGEAYNPLEAGLMEFISFNKGCYVGQEVVARLNTYKKVQKHLVRLSWERETPPADDAGLFSEGKKMGTLTSASRVPHWGRWVGLGYVRKAQAAARVRLTLEAPDSRVVVEVVGPSSGG